jgi:hypothetical protein
MTWPQRVCNYHVLGKRVVYATQFSFVDKVLLLEHSIHHEYKGGEV